MKTDQDTEAKLDEERPRRGGAALLAFIPLATFAALATIFYFGLYRGDPSTLPSTLIGKAVPEFALPALEGLRNGGSEVPGFATADLAGGEVALVNVWASWCGPCRAEHPYLMHLAEEEGIAIFGINNKDTAANARRFLGHHGNPFAAVGTDDDGRVSIDWGVYGVPETFVVDGTGTIVYKHVGQLTQSVLENDLLPAIRQAGGG